MDVNAFYACKKISLGPGYGGRKMIAKEMMVEKEDKENGASEQTLERFIHRDKTTNLERAPDKVDVALVSGGYSY